MYKGKIRRLVVLYTSKPEITAVTVRLKSGAVFSGTIDRMSRYTHNDETLHLSFTNIAWFNEATNQWNEREGLWPEAWHHQQI